MTIAELFIIAVGLSMDACAVAICKGLSVKKATLKQALIVGAYFGGFQALMPAIGYLLGSQFQSLIVANKRGLTPYTADVYIDCSGDADVAAYAGVPFEYGDGNGNVQHSSLCYAIAGADVSKLNGKIISSNPEYNFWQPIIAEGKHPNVTDHFVPAYHGNTIVYCNAGDLVGVDATSPESLSEAYAHGRALAQDFLNALIDYEPEAFGNAVIVATAPVMGTRESRRIKCITTLQMEDYFDQTAKPLFHVARGMLVEREGRCGRNIGDIVFLCGQLSRQPAGAGGTFRAADAGGRDSGLEPGRAVKALLLRQYGPERSERGQLP